MRQDQELNAHDAALRSGEQDVNEEIESMDEDPVALSLALPPSSPLPTSSQAIPSTPPICLMNQASSRSSFANPSSIKTYGSPGSAIKRKPVPTAIATPKVQVYDDSKPPNTQPQTPADLKKPHRAKSRSDTAVHQSPIFVGRTMISSPPAIPERLHHISTGAPGPPYLAALPTAEGNFAAAANVVEPSVPGRARRQRTRRRAQTARSGDQAENNLEVQLHGLEADRRTWLDRREDGSLDVTPPREGRFERYLL